MASVRENKVNGKTSSFQFVVFLGRDAEGKHIRRYRTWIPPEGMTYAKAKKAAKREADAWERQLKMEFEREQHSIFVEVNHSTTESRRDDFVTFVNETWYELYICNGDRKDTTAAFYEDIASYITDYFKGAILQEITPIQIQQYLQHLRKSHKGRAGNGLSARYLRHHYGTLRNIFNYAERNDFIVKNPMKSVKAPKLPKKPVDALTHEQAAIVFEKLADCTLEFQTMMYLLITTGLRRGELIGLQWGDVDEKNQFLHIQRGVAYTSKTGIVVSTPKTTSSIRIVPLMFSTFSLLMKLKAQRAGEYPKSDLNNAYIFPSKDDLYYPRDPNTVTKRTRAFMKKCGLPAFSPHDLRHTCGTLLLAETKDVKAVQTLLGHSDASVTLNYYVRSDIKQVQNATDKFAEAFGL